jgi:hypothetical protein
MYKYQQDEMSAALWSIEPWKPPAPGGPAVWGPSGWDWLLELALAYPLNPSIRDVRKAGELLIEFFETVPCLECYAHILRYVIHTPPNLMNGESLQHWVWAFHNDVNLRTGKPYMDMADYRIRYKDRIRLASLRGVHEG